MKIDLYNRLYLVSHFFEPEEETLRLYGSDQVIQEKAYKFSKTLLLYEIHDKLSIVSLNPIEMDTFMFLTNAMDLRYKLDDVTEKAILDELDVDNEAMRKVVIPFLKINLDVDIVLDKISLKGIKSLNKIDKKILKSFK